MARPDGLGLPLLEPADSGLDKLVYSPSSGLDGPDLPLVHVRGRAHPSVHHLFPSKSQSHRISRPGSVPSPHYCLRQLRILQHPHNLTLCILSPMTSRCLLFSKRILQKLICGNRPRGSYEFHESWSCSLSPPWFSILAATTCAGIFKGIDPMRKSRCESPRRR